MNGLTSVLQDNSSFTDNEIIQEEEEADSLMIQSIRNQGIRMEYKFDSEDNLIKFRSLIIKNEIPLKFHKNINQHQTG